MGQISKPPVPQYGHPRHPEIHYHFSTFSDFWLVAPPMVTCGPPSAQLCPPGSNL